MFFPDYDGIEIKCQQRYSRYPLTLFSKALDGPYLYSTNEFLEKYGSKNYEYGKNEMNINISANSLGICNSFFHKIKVDRINQKIYIETYNYNYDLIERTYYVDFQSIKKIVELKLNMIAHIRASMKKIGNKRYFRYYSIKIYKIKSFECFISLLEKGIINCSFIGRVSKTNYTPGRNKNKGMHFSINQENIEQLFDCIYYYSTDKKTNHFD